MKPPAKPPNRIGNPARPSQNTLAVQQRPAAQPKTAPQNNTRALANARPPTAAGVPNRTATQARSVGPHAGANSSSPAAQRVASRPGAPTASKAANYTVQGPVNLGSRSQQIRATIQGTPQIAGSVEISSAGSGRVFISNLKVDQQHRRRGVAAKLIDAAINTARRQGFSAASLEARPSDRGITPQTLVAMYRRKGFKSVGKSGRGNPLMERKL